MPATPVVDADPSAPEPEDRPRRHHRLRTALIVAGAVLVLLIGAAAVILVSSDPAREVPVEEAKERVGDTTIPAVGGTRPSAGVYVFEGEGTEDTSFPPLVEQQGPHMPATVEWSGDDCFAFRIDLNNHHWVDWDFCRDGNTMTEHGGTNFARRDLEVMVIDAVSEFVCDPPFVILDLDAEEGDVTEGSCTGTNDLIAGETVSESVNTFVGTEELTIGGETVEAWRVRSHRVFEGAQDGVDDYDIWFAVNGLPLQMERETQADTSTPFGDVHYEETTRWMLTSMTPQ